ncbi:MarR family winged helix-turn-helix transcriptional regulator [Streptomyces varsoviensis]|uniref:MarR family transcriptional regulator n=1 Tax=Streptomyces varsoviensis TaxID=67373 RepID=A0ABR5IVB9_9ACTN|nr:MarR family transcriptional regulator [Streptomyces varsoviensis]KOG85090.1 MarR family transcriptional regulator [Streptomyces varsoviensis]
MAEEPTPTHGDIAARRDRLVEGLRTYGGQHTELSRGFAAWLGLHSTDAVALLEIISAEERGTALSPARLAERIPLSSGATTALLNRLEAAGHIVRTREHADRRIVTLHSSPHIQERADEFFGPLGARVDALLTRYPPELLDRFDEFLREMCAALNAHITEVSQTSQVARPGRGG